jgi:hypothetical protein
MSYPVPEEFDPVHRSQEHRAYHSDDQRIRAVAKLEIEDRAPKPVRWKRRSDGRFFSQEEALLLCEVIERAEKKSSTQY